MHHPATFKPIDYEQALNPQQLKVVKEADGYSLVLAGAGSGKTRVLVYRLAYLLEKGVPAGNIALITFTNKAAREMLERSAALVGRELYGLWGGTFHHLANMILRKEATHIGFTPDFTILDREDSKDLIEECTRAVVADKEKAFPKKEVIMHVISLSMNAQESLPAVVEARYDHLIEYTEELVRIAALYQEKKKKSDLMDFDDLLTCWHEVLLIDPVREKYARLFRYILVDEHQDTNRVQFKILQQLCTAHKNLLAVGDDAQSIYSFRAADVNNILDFPRIFEGTKTFPLTINYRSTPDILEFANQSIVNNKRQFPKELTTEKEPFEKPRVIKTYDVYQQAEWCAQTAEQLRAEGIALHKIAFLFRSRYQAMELEMELLKQSIPYVLRGGVRFFEQAHIKDALSYLKIKANPKDETAFKRAVKMHRGISFGYAQRIWDAVSTGTRYEGAGRALPERACAGYEEFLKVMRRIETEDKPAALIESVLDAFYRDFCKTAFEDYLERVRELEELAQMAGKFLTLKQFLSDLLTYEHFKGELPGAQASSHDRLVLSTIHQAKGLEWEAVIVIGCAEGGFPNPKAFEEDLLEEERRLFYVAVTRAKTRLCVCYPHLRYTASGGAFFARPSLFLEELPESAYEFIDYSTRANAPTY